MSLALWLYHRAPYPLKCTLAAARGRQLRKLRHGPGMEQAVEAALRRDRWSASDWQRWTAPRLEAFLERAARVVPHYRQHGGPGPGEAAAGLSAWPILPKQAVRTTPDAFHADDRPTADLHAQQTSGTTGTPMTFWWSVETVRAWHALYEARIRQWHGVTRDDRWGILGGQLVTHVARRRPPYWVWNDPMRQLYLSVYHISPATIRAYVDAMANHRIRYLLGYPSALAAVARLGRAADLEGPRLEVVLTNAEPLGETQRSDIASFFGCPVRDTYGMAEGAAGASECEAGSLHLWPEAGIVEVVDDDGRPCPAGEVGRLLLTGLLHDAMPLIRYEIGDRGALAPTDDSCPCGRGLPRIQAIEGRADDVIRTPDGRLVGRLDPVFKGDGSVHEAQAIQTDADTLVVKVVPGARWSDAAARRVVARFQQRLAGMRIDVEVVDSIPRGANGKFRAVISRLRDPSGRA